MRLFNRAPDTIINRVSDDGFKLTWNASEEGVDLYLYGEVGNEYDAADAASINQVLRQHRGKPITLRVNSFGGLAYDGVAIHNALQDHDGPTTGIIEGVAASAASIAVIGCDTVKCYKNSSFHIHQSLAVAYGHEWEIMQTVEWLKTLDEQLAETYADVGNKTLEEMRVLLHGPNGDGTVFNAKDAKEAGFVHEILQGKSGAPSTRSRELSEKQTVAAARLRLRQRQLDLTRRRN